MITAALAGIAFLINNYYSPLSPVVIAIIAGLLISNFIGTPAACKQGIDYCAKKLLKLGIVFLGIRLSFFEILDLGANSLAIIITCIILALTVVISLSKKFGVPPRLATLIAVGTAICGNSAIVATSPVIKAKEEEVAFAVGTITVFGLSAIVFYPVIGAYMHLSPVEFGTWAGTAINDTGQVVAAGFQYGITAGEAATVVKLTRNLFIAPVVVLFAYLTAKEEAGQSSFHFKGLNLFRIFPWFVLGFLVMAFLRTADLLPDLVIGLLSFTSAFLLVMALGGIGLSINLASMKGLGLKAFLAGLLAAVVMGTTSLLLILLIL